jgi:SSS family solute:Na+ symporter
MAIGSANLFASNVFNQFSSERTSGETRIAKRLTVVFCAVALLFVLFVPVKYAIYFQLLGGAWMLQIFPAFVFGLYTQWFHPRALLAGWACGMLTGTVMAVSTGFNPNITVHIAGTPITGFIALYALAINLIITALGTIALGGNRAVRQS